MKRNIFKTIAGLFLSLTILSGLSAHAFADETDESEEKAKSPSEYKYQVPDGLPVVDIESWEYRLADTWNSIGLYDASVSYLYGTGIDSRVYESAVAMIESVREAGYSITVTTGNLSWLYYKTLAFPGDVALYGSAREACKHVLAPGCDDHQTGLSFDVEGDADGIDYMKKHCAEYGFIYRYPEDKAEYYGVACPNAHFRYVGEEAAKYIYDNSLCFEEYLLLYGYPVKTGTLD